MICDVTILAGKTVLSSKLLFNNKLFENEKNQKTNLSIAPIPSLIMLIPKLCNYF